MNATARALTCGAILLLSAVAASIRPRRRLSVSEWADTQRKLSSKGSSEPGDWKTSRTPFLREIMDVLSVSSTVQTVVVMKSAQVGVTETGLNWIGYVIDEAPAPMLVVVPTLEVRKRWVLQRLSPLLRETPVLADKFGGMRKRDSANSEDIKDFPGGMLVIGGANSPASLASMPIAYTLLDEVDRFPWEVGNEGDPLGLIRERQKTFPRRKELLISTPTVKGASRIEEEYEKTDQRRYYVPCPHCDEPQHLQWTNLRWDKGLNVAWYVCQHCGAVIDEAAKTRMLTTGCWVAAHPERKSRGYHINALYAPLGLGNTWLELARQWLECHDDPVKLKRFINTTLGEPWEDRQHDVKPHALMERAESYALRTIPPGCLILTAGIDVQGNRVALHIIGWGRNETCWVIDYVEIPGDLARDEIWSALSAALNTPFRNTYGMEMRIQAAAIDTGGSFTHETYMYVRSKPTRRLIAIKGSNVPNKSILAGRPSAQDINWKGKTIKGGVQLWMVGSDTAKHVLFRRLASDAGTEASGRRVRFPADLELDYYTQLTSEAFDPERNKWVKRRGKRNEVLDTWCYAYAAAMHPEVRVHAMRARDWDELARVLEPVSDSSAAESAAPDINAQASGTPAPAAKSTYLTQMMRSRRR